MDESMNLYGIIFSANFPSGRVPLEKEILSDGEFRMMQFVMKYLDMKLNNLS
jgi:hypothetical protein